MKLATITKVEALQAKKQDDLVLIKEAASMIHGFDLVFIDKSTSTTFTIFSNYENYYIEIVGNSFAFIEGQHVNEKAIEYLKQLNAAVKKL